MGHANLSLYYSQFYDALQPLLKDSDENYTIFMSCSPCGYHDSNSSCIKCITTKNYIKDSITAWYFKLTDALKLLADSTVPAIVESSIKYWWLQE